MTGHAPGGRLAVLASRVRYEEKRYAAALVREISHSRKPGRDIRVIVAGNIAAAASYRYDGDVTGQVLIAGGRTARPLTEPSGTPVELAP